jgi:hemoglobin
MKRGLMRGAALGVLVAVVAGCAGMMGRAEPTLYERLRLTDDNGTPLSGRSAISQIVDDFVANVVADNRINARFKALKPPEVFRLKANLSDQICQAAGGPCSYLGRDMKETHKGMKITDAEWNATVEALVKALDKRKVPAREKNELIALLAPMKKDIVGQ